MKITLPSAPTRWLTIVTFVCTMFFSQAGYSQLIGSWNFNNTINGVPGSNNTVSIADFSTGVPSTSFNGGMEYFGQNGWPAGALDPSLYLEFTLTPNSGYSLNVSALYLRLRHSNTGSNGGSGPKTFSLRSSLDGYNTDVFTGSLTSNYSYHTINPGSSFTNLPTAVTFRVYGYNAVVNSGGTSRFVFDNIDVNGIGVILPVRLRSFNVTKINESVKVNYFADNSSPGAQYIVERSAGGNDFTRISTATQQTNDPHFSNEIVDSEFSSDAETLHYRLVIHAVDGSVSVSPVVTLRMQSRQTPLRAFARNNTVYLSGINDTDSEVMILTPGGQVLAKHHLEGSNSINTIIYPGSYSGTLHVVVVSKTGRRTVSVIAL
ncbi:MAG: hypothetical protein EOO02_09450 [Chitinophagaceae bacterium]|nr:MAG: hypothetical protein EOO02_09450 [Chitinophagaceae bacterium]